MNKKIITGYIRAILFVLLIVSSATAINLTPSVFEKTDKKNDSIESKQIEIDNSPEEEKPAGLFTSMLIIQTYFVNPKTGKMNARGVRVRCEDLDSNYDQTRTTRGFFALAFFFGLKIGHRYRISAPGADKLEIKMSGNPMFRALRVDG